MTSAKQAMADVNTSVLTQREAFPVCAKKAINSQQMKGGVKVTNLTLQSPLQFKIGI